MRSEPNGTPRLVVEADSPNVLAQKLRSLIPELLELNGVTSDRTASFHVVYQHEESGVLSFWWPAILRASRKFSLRMHVTLSGRVGVTMKSGLRSLD